MRFAPNLRRLADAKTAERLKKAVSDHGRTDRVASLVRLKGGGTRHIVDFRRIRKSLPPRVLLSLLVGVVGGKTRVVFANPLEAAYTSLVRTPGRGESDAIIIPKASGPFTIENLLGATFAALWWLDDGRGLITSVIDRNLIVIGKSEDDRSRTYLATRQTHGEARCRPRAFDKGILRFLTTDTDRRVIVDGRRHEAWRGATLPREADSTLVVTTSVPHVQAWREFFGTGTADLVIDGFASKKPSKHHQASPHGPIGKHQKNPLRGATRAEALQ